MWVGLIQSVEDLKSNNWSFPEKKKFCLKTMIWKSHLGSQPSGLPYRFWTQNCTLTLTWISSLSACPTDFILVNLLVVQWFFFPRETWSATCPQQKIPWFSWLSKHWDPVLSSFHSPNQLSLSFAPISSQGT